MVCTAFNQLYLCTSDLGSGSGHEFDQKWIRRSLRSVVPSADRDVILADLAEDHLPPHAVDGALADAAARAGGRGTPRDFYEMKSCN